jgi:hypothetical protein
MTELLMLIFSPVARFLLMQGTMIFFKRVGLSSSQNKLVYGWYAMLFMVSIISGCKLLLLVRMKSQYSANIIAFGSFVL